MLIEYINIHVHTHHTLFEIKNNELFYYVEDTKMLSNPTLFFIRGKNKIFRKGGNHRVFIRVYVQHDPVLGSKSKLG